MQMFETKLLIFGATAFAAGVCQEYGGKALLVDGSDLPAAEFTAALRSDGGEGAACSTGAGAAFQQELRQRGLLPEKSGAWPHLPAVHPVVCKYMYQSGARCLFRTAVLSVQRATDGWRVRVFTTGGLREILAQALLDTTSCGVAQPLLGGGRPAIAAQFLNAEVLAPNGVQSIKDGCFSVVPGVRENEGYLRFALPIGTTCAQAHEMLYQAWQHRGKRLADYRISYAAPVLDVLPAVLQGVGNWAPSVGFGNVVRAFDAGVQYAQQGEVQGR